VKEDVAKHVKELKEMASIYSHAADVYDVFQVAYKRLADLMDHIASVEAKLDKILWRIER